MKENTKRNLKAFFEAKKFTKILALLGSLVFAVVIFSAGVVVGFNKAKWTRDADDNFAQNFGPHHHYRKILGDTPDAFPNANGALGKLIKVELPTFIVSDKDGTEKVILITDDTEVRSGSDEVTPSDLKVGGNVLVIGSPNDKGQIEAGFIRIISQMPN